MASLQPRFGIGGQENDILDFIAKIKLTDNDKTISIKTAEMEEKNVGIQMLTVFIDELEEMFAPYIQQTSELFISLIDYTSCDDIRNSVANSLPTMLKCLKKTDPDVNNHNKYAEAYIQSLFQAISKERSTDTMIYQVLSCKEIVNTMGDFMS